ncbi:ORF1-RNA2 [Squash chlorotic leaf spot virus]|uniref:ORF1-RNA2 n=1 Tax=Squash chlorotic leaf spot virus TaxID=1810396 RepID=A0A140H460_9SECO|nr:ORF1-RNA2 [Squash chlorotic leaf spot virus]AMN91911.1 ORF1-RNA2 [Squash chlorotic leaf spot virus]
MDLIDKLDISRERQDFQKLLKDTKWSGTVAIEAGYLSSTPTLTLLSEQPSGEKEIFLSLKWTSWIPQPVGHLLLPGEWSVTDVEIDGPLVEAACRLNAVYSASETLFSSASTSSASTTQESAQLAQLTQTNKTLETDLALLRQKEKELQDALKTLQQQNLDLVTRISQFTNATSKPSKSSPFEKKKTVLPPRPWDGQFDFSTFKPWASDPPAGQISNRSDQQAPRRSHRREDC